jgi:cell division initiation protein
MEEKTVTDEVLSEVPELAVSELYSADFKTRFRGYDKERVRGFLARVADAYETLHREVRELRQANKELREQAQGYREMEKALTEALATAQAAAETTTAQAKREAELILEEARLKRTEAEAKQDTLPAQLREEIASLRAKRARLKADLRAVLDIHLGLLDDTGSVDGASVEFMPGDHGYRAPDGQEAPHDESTTEGETQ